MMTLLVIENVVSCSQWNVELETFIFNNNVCLHNLNSKREGKKTRNVIFNLTKFNESMYRLI